MPLIRLQPHPFTSIPPHPSLPDDAPRPELRPYIIAALHEALDLLASIPSTFTADPKLRPSSPSQAKVKLLRKWRHLSSAEPATVPGAAGSGSAGPGAQNKTDSESNSRSRSEFWVCRQSEHVNARADGTASWAEFQEGLRTDHAQHEMEYTPTVSAVEKLLDWNEAHIGEIEVDGVTFKDVEMEVNLITHTFKPSFLISPRCFISLTISAAYHGHPSTPSSHGAEQPPTPEAPSFLTLQIPLHAAAPSTPPALLKTISASIPKRAVLANYASIERAELRSRSTSPSASGSSQSKTSSSYTEWTMATTSDAAGSIPQWVQRSWALGGVPKAVVADVGLFIGWTMRRRGTAAT
ncbi:hypothetical protein N7539_003047 [Penicillium diatomitis]|uniref:DUF3074 domain-containing protein n=1 Tax=Penicillium diatomitis TaxID=2819901 RepID=A0A9W9XFT9_9EURO|nr:uncharacterized protein N7539_003047 [Penicillium diatomitis]KAJ5491480.1 hypothetical protein N7539_003047 [Penicillium diatomitis]